MDKVQNTLTDMQAIGKTFNETKHAVSTIFSQMHFGAFI